ncbi:MAG: HEPN domain-containing protein, partial [Sphingobacteriaceae bacterium]
WEQSQPYKTEIGVGECAGVMIDLVATLLLESDEKLANADASFSSLDFADAIYYAYTAFINTAKAMLIAENLKTNTQAGIVTDFDTNFVATNKIDLDLSFEALVYQINQQEPTEDFAAYYIEQSKIFKQKALDFRNMQLTEKAF